jgi:glycosyltransferase involved in cell wall biosynthesis
LSRNKIIYILSNIHKALAFEWITEELDKNKWEISFILLNPGSSSLEKYLQYNNIEVTRITYCGKKDLPKAIYNIYRIIKRKETQIVHCHLFDACIAGLFAAKLAGVRKRIFTRHHATFHQEYFPRAVWYDKLISNMATDIVAISENVRNTLIQEEVNPAKIHLIHHGFKLNEFIPSDISSVEILRKKYNKFNAFPVIGIISRYFELKGIQYIIPAFVQLLSKYPNALLILANASGNYKEEIKILLKDVPIKNYLEIAFEEDIFSLYQLFDVFIHVPIDPQIEAFGQTYVEALAAGIPSIFTMSGVAPEFIIHHKNAWVVPFKDYESILNAILEILAEKELKQRIIKQGEEDVYQMFTLQKMINRLENLYAS